MTPRPWYKKKRYIAPLAILGLFTVVGAMGDSSAPSPVPVEQTATAAQVFQQAVPSSFPEVETNTQTTVTTPTPTPSYDSNPPLSNDNYYINSTGNEVHSPAYAPSVPPGASALCRDGTYSFSQSRRGTCSHHGGVAQWL